MVAESLDDRIWKKRTGGGVDGVYGNGYVEVEVGFFFGVVGGWFGEEFVGVVLDHVPVGGITGVVAFGKSWMDFIFVVGRET